MEAEAAKIANGAQRLAMVGTHDALRRILYHLQIVLSGDFHDGIHLTGHARIVDRNDHTGLIGNGCLDLGLVNVHGIRTNIHKYKLCTSQHKGIGRRRESKAGQDHLISGLQITKKSSHLQCVAARGGQEHLLAFRHLLQQLVAFLCKLSITTNFMCSDCFGNILHLFAYIRRSIKRNHVSSHSKLIV